MSKKDKYHISYTAIYGQLWEYLVCQDLVHEIYPPPLNVIWDGNVNDCAMTKGQPDKFNNDAPAYATGLATARMNSKFIHFEETKTVNPWSYELIIYHFAQMTYYQKEFGTIPSGPIAWTFAMHDILHEFGHYNAGYHLWLRFHSERTDIGSHDYDTDYNNYLNYIDGMGQTQDEKDNEKWTLNVLCAANGCSLKNFPKFDGPYVDFLIRRHPNRPDTRSTIAALEHFVLHYRLTFCRDKMTEKEYSRVRDRLDVVDDWITDQGKKEKREIIYEA